MNKIDSRSALAEALKRALAGEPDPAHLRATISNPHRLSALEKSAWLQLHNWSADEYLRSQFPKHAEFSERRMIDLLLQLEE